MTNEIVNTNTGEVRAVGQVWTPEQVALIRKQFFPAQLSDDHFKVFLYSCKQYDLNPITREIYAISRMTKQGTVMSIQTGIDGFAKNATRTGQYVGMDAPVYTYDGDKRIVSCSVTIYRMVQGARCPFTAVGFYNEYVVPTNPNWAKMPHSQLAKCVRALAFRMAFPNELSGLYTSEEMEQAGGATAPTVIEAEAEVSGAPQQGAPEQSQDEPAKSPAFAIEREMPSKYGTPESPNKCGLCGERHIVEGDRIVLVNKIWGAEKCLKPHQVEPTAPRASVAQVRAVFAIIGDLRANKLLQSLPDELYTKAERWELGSLEKSHENASYLLENLKMFQSKGGRPAPKEQTAMPFANEESPFPDDEVEYGN